MLSRDVVHGDLSADNVLVWEGRATVIDLPQDVDAKKNRFARRLLERDVRRICEHFERCGVRADPHRIADDLDLLGARGARPPGAPGELTVDP